MINKFFKKHFLFLITTYIAVTFLFGGCSMPVEDVSSLAVSPQVSAEPSTSAPPSSSISSVSSENSEDFTLTAQQANDLLQQVAAPLLLTEWDVRIGNYSELFKVSNWQNSEIIPVTDFDIYDEGPLRDRPYWFYYVPSLFEAPIEGKEEFAIVPGEKEYGISYEDLESYLIDAFGYATEYYFPLDYKGNYEQSDSEYPDFIINTDYDTYIETEEITQPVNVKNNRVTFSAVVTGDALEANYLRYSGRWEHDDALLKEVPFEITLEVVQNPESRYGCTVTGFYYNAVDFEEAPSFDGVWTDEYIYTIVIDGENVSFYISDDSRDNVFETLAGSGEGKLYKDLGILTITTPYKGIEATFDMKILSDQEMEVTFESGDVKRINNYEKINKNPPNEPTEIWTPPNLDGEWSVNPLDEIPDYIIEGTVVTIPAEGVTFDGAFDMNGILSFDRKISGEIYKTSFRYLYDRCLWVTTVSESEPYEGYSDEYFRKIGTEPPEASSGTSSAECEYEEEAVQTSSDFNVDGLLFPDSSYRYLTAEELAPLDKEMLGYARNEIFARHGNVFETPKYRDWYSQFAWYNSLPKVADVGYPDLNEYEIANVELIKQFEAA